MCLSFDLFFSLLSSRSTGLPRSSSASSRDSNTTAARRSSLRIFFSFLSSFITSFGFSLVFFSISFLRGSVSFTFFFLPSSYVTIFSLGASSKMISFFLRSFPSLDLCTLSLTTFSTLSFFLMTPSSGKRSCCCCFFFFFSIGSFLSRPDFSFFFFSPF